MLPNSSPCRNVLIVGLISQHVVAFAFPPFWISLCEYAHVSESGRSTRCLRQQIPKYWNFGFGIIFIFKQVLFFFFLNITNKINNTNKKMICNSYSKQLSNKTKLPFQKKKEEKGNITKFVVRF